MLHLIKFERQIKIVGHMRSKNVEPILSIPVITPVVNNSYINGALLQFK